MAFEPLAVHSVRVTARIQVGSFHREVDISLPSATTLADAMPEIVELASAPRIDRPWRATTAAGMPIDTSVPVHSTPVEHGSVLVISPAEPVEAPIVRDSAEALASIVGHRAGAVGAAQMSTAVGIAGVCALLGLVVPWAVASAITAVLALAVCAWRRSALLLAATAILFAATAGAITVGARTVEAAPWAVLAGVGAAATMGVVVAVLGALPAQWVAVGGMLGALGLAAAAGLSAPQWSAIPAAALILVLCVVMAAPTLATTWAGLKVPVVPTAGQDLAAADGEQPDVDTRAIEATRIHDGLSIGCAVGAIPAVLALGWHGSVWSQLACLAVTGAVLLHAARHASPVPAWCLTLIGLAALAGVVLAACQPGAHLGQVLLAGVTVVLAASSFLWAPRLRFIEPTRMVWIERAETLAIIAAIPLLLHALGLFSLIRGMG